MEHIDTVTMEPLISQTRPLFNPEMYIHRYKNFSPDSSAFPNPIVKCQLDILHEIFKKGQIHGARLLDIGSGPVYHHMYAASQWFREITLSDLSELNLNVLREWKAGKIYQDFERVFRYMLSLEGKLTDKWEEVIRQLSNKVKNIVHCDLHNKRLLDGPEVDGTLFDAVLLSFTQSSASFCREEYMQAIQNYTRHLKQGGHVIVIDSLGETMYDIGQKRLRTKCFTKEELVSMYRESGYEVVMWIANEDLYDAEAAASGMSDLKGVFGLVGRKT